MGMKTVFGTLIRQCDHHFSDQLNRVASFQAVSSYKRCYSDRAYFHQVGSEPLQYRNLGQQLQRAVQKYGKRPALISCHEDKRYSFEELKHEAEKLALHLHGLGMQSGDHLGIWATNTTHWYISFMAAALAGLPVVCINPALQPQEIEYALKKAKVKALITMDECGKQNFYSILRSILPNAKSSDQLIDEPSFPALRRVVMRSKQPKVEFIDFDGLMQNPVRSQDLAYLNYKVPQISPETTCNIQFTSGTTGQPKAALITHFTYINSGHYFGMHLKLNESHKHICYTVPIFHAYGLGILMSALTHGATLVFPSPTFNGAAALNAVEKEHCNVILGTPTMYVDMLEQQRQLKKSLHSLEMGLVGAASCTPEVFAQVKSVFGLKYMLNGYGMSEGCAAFFTQDTNEALETAVSSVGRLYEHSEAKVINDRGETVAFGERGELCVRGYYVMTGYMDDEKRTKEVLDEHGWLKTGDEFILESNGIGRVVGRKKDIVIRGGENIFPREIEDFLDTHPDILEAQVIGVPDPRMGEEVCVYLRLRPDSKGLSAEEVKQFCKGRIAHFKIPRYVRIISDYPKTSSGKIQKFKLREFFQHEAAQQNGRAT